VTFSPFEGVAVSRSEWAKTDKGRWNTIIKDKRMDKTVFFIIYSLWLYFLSSYIKTKFRVFSQVYSLYKSLTLSGINIHFKPILWYSPLLPTSKTKTYIGYKELTIARIKGGKIDGLFLWQFFCIGSSVIYSIDYCRGSLLLLIKDSIKEKPASAGFFFFT
jgi:hypothetical protein